MVEPLLYAIPAVLEVMLSSEVLEHVANHRQLTLKAKEAGGQLFARIDGSHWTVVRATGPRRRDWRSRFGFRPDRSEERTEIQSLFDEGLHYVGDWHTHPEARPSPSGTDIESMDELVSLSKHELPGFLMLIVGNDPFPAGLWASLHLGGQAYLRLPLAEGNRGAPNSTPSA